MDGAISSSLFSIARSNCSSVACLGPGLMKISVEAHQTMTTRSHLFFALKSRMSWRSCSARSRLVFPFLTFVPWMRVTYLFSNTAGIGLMLERKSLIGSRSRSSSTPAFFAAVYASSAIGSQAPNTMSSSAASGTKSLISGERFSVRLPRRIVAIWVSDPIGCVWPRRTLSTPAMKVVATAPSPGVMIPSLPVAGRGVDTASEDEPGTYLLSFEQRARGAASRPEPRPSLGVRARFRLFRSRGRRIDVGHALDHGDPGRYGQNDDDDGQHPPVEHEPEKGLRGGEEDHSLRALEHAHLGVQPECLGAGPGVGRQERPDQPHQADDEHRDA